MRARGQRGRLQPVARAMSGRLALPLACIAVLGLGVVLGGCASDSSSSSRSSARSGSSGSSAKARGGSYHTVRKGENLYRIGKHYGIPTEVLREANRIADVTTLRVGQRLWIPAAGKARKAGRVGPTAGRLRSSARSEAGIDFSWPVRGRLTSRYGRRGRSPHEGIDIGAPKGTSIVAAEAGKVIHVGRMGDYGKLVIVKHAGNFRSVYAHVNRYHVREGNFVEKGQRIADVGRTGNASGPHLHFEIRERDRPRDPMLYLP